MQSIYHNTILKFPKIVLSLSLLVLIYLSIHIKNFNLDASSDALLLENDTDLKYLREVNNKYGARDFLVLTYTPIKDFVDDDTILDLKNLKQDILNLNWVENVITILDVPLFKSSDEPLMERIKSFKTLANPEIDKEQAIKELTQSIIFKNYIISEDAKTSGIIVYLEKDTKLDNFIKIRNSFIERQYSTGLNNEEKQSFKNFNKEYNDYRNLYNKRNHQNISEIRSLINKYQKSSKIHLGGIPMIADDMMSFIKSDIIVFGIGVLLFIVIILWLIFREIKWIVIPLCCCVTSVLSMMGILGLIGWKVTVISSNFIALMLILNMAMNIHLTVRYLQISKEKPELAILERINEAVKKMFLPILYTVLTTVCAFLSLIFSNIRPIIDFGWMMTMGLIVSLLVTFLILPSLLNILTFKSTDINKVDNNSHSKINQFLSYIATNNFKFIKNFSILLLIISIFGITKLKVENSFINYFDKDTEIYSGMKLIDEKLGGTTPFDIIIKFPSLKVKKNNTNDEFEEWDNENDNGAYWFTRDKIDKINNVHDYLESLPEVGKVMSFASIIRVAEDLNGKQLGTLEMSVLNSKLPENVKKEIISPYISVASNEARISARIKDSLEDLERNKLINMIETDLENKINLNKDEYRLSGVLIIFNNLLQSLFKSQILTLGFVMLGILLMFIILFRDIKLSIIGVIPNFLAALMILGIIGILNIPLDMMTITIAAITIGIAVDNSIHYIYRFKEEFSVSKDYERCIDKCHQSVGVAILNTSITIIFGFSILILSKFIPTIYFGLFTGLAMFLAMLLVLTLLPSLLILFKPLKNN